MTCEVEIKKKVTLSAANSFTFSTIRFDEVNNYGFVSKFCTLSKLNKDI